MFIPFRDDNPVHATPYLSYGIIGLCVLVFLYQMGLNAEATKAFIFTYGLIPASLFDGAPRPVPAEISPLLTVITSMFLHGDFMHLAGNMLYLWIFADNIESAMGRLRFAAFYLICGVAAALAHALVTPASMIPMVGASGAISGVLGAYLLMYPRANIRMVFGFFLFWRLFNIPAWVVLGLWFGMQFLGLAQQSGDGPGVAFWAHIGGFVAGMALVRPFLRRGERLFHGRHSRPWEVRTQKSLPDPRRTQSWNGHQESQFIQGRGPLRRKTPPPRQKGPWE